MQHKINCTWICLLIFSFLSFGCATNTLVNKTTTAAVSTRQVVLSHRIALFGFLELSPPVQLKQVCNSQDWARIETGFSPLNVAVSVLTLGLYTPATVTVTCLN